MGRLPVHEHLNARIRAVADPAAYSQRNGLDED